MTDLPSSYSANRMRLLSSSSIEWFFSFISTISTSWSSLFHQSIPSFTVYQLYGNQTATTTWHSTNSFSTSFQSNLSVDNQYDPVVGWAECSERQSISIQPRLVILIHWVNRKRKHSSTKLFGNCDSLSPIDRQQTLTRLDSLIERYRQHWTSSRLHHTVRLQIYCKISH